jgi:5-methylcytosine-specific restriction enzyme subunit McrC
MEIPIQNIFYLLCYAWDKLDEGNRLTVDTTDLTDATNLFAKVLINGCSHLFRRGLDRNYIEIEEAIPGIKGKICFSQTIKQNLIRKNSTFCIFDDFHYNIPHNQIIKTTLAKLIRIKGINPDIKDQLINVYRRFQNVEEINIDRKSFSNIRLHRNNHFYYLVLKVCQIINENIFIDENAGKYVFKDFIRDERKMRYLFENFVRNFYKKEQKTYSVFSEYIRWNALALGNTTLDYLPVMKTDISLESKVKKIIIDTKYYSEALVKNYDKEKIRTNNWYQLHAYLTNIESRGGFNENCDGILLYPTVTKVLDENYKIGNHKVSIKTINLNQPWQMIRDDLLAIIE